MITAAHSAKQDFLPTPLTEKETHFHEQIYSEAHKLFLLSIGRMIIRDPHVSDLLTLDLVVCQIDDIDPTVYEVCVFLETYFQKIPQNKALTWDMI